MKPIHHIGTLTLLAPMLGAFLLADPSAAQAPQASAPAVLPSETPTQFAPVTDSFDYARRDVMIPMRDGVKLHTVVLVPKGAKNAPILLTRTPYDANELTARAHSSHLGPSLHGYDNALEVILEGGYIRVVQDVRGKYGSEGDYVMNRPLRGPLNPTTVDHSTDTYDTIDWLVKNIPESNGKVGILGISYDGFTPLMALVNPHPALKVSVPMNPWLTAGWATTGFTMAPSASKTCRTSTNRKRREKTRNTGGLATTTTTTCICKRVRRENWAGVTVLNRWASGGKFSNTRPTTLGGSNKRWIRFLPRSR